MPNRAEAHMIGCLAAYGTKNAVQIAKATGMSRQYVAMQRDSVLSELRESLAEGSAKEIPPRDTKWCFTVRIDYSFVCSFVILAAMVFHASFAQICQFFRLLFERGVSETTARQIISEASVNCRTYNETVDYGGVEQIASDEIFQNGDPVLACVCLDSGAVVGIRAARDRTKEQWGSFFSGLRDGQGLSPAVNVSDAGTGLRAGSMLAFPDAQSQMDSMHLLQCVTPIKTSMERKAMSAMAEAADIESAVDSGRRVWSKTLERYLAMGAEMEHLIGQYDDFSILFGWLREILDFGGYFYGEAKELAEWLLGEMAAVAPDSRELKHQVEKIRRLLPSALLHLQRVESKIADIAGKDGDVLSLLIAVYKSRALVPMSEAHSRACYRAGVLAGNADTLIEAERTVSRIIHGTKRASSWIENLNSRLRKYMDIKREVSDDFLAIVQTFINTMPCVRTRIAEWKGTTPLERLCKKKHPSFIDIALGRWCAQSV